MVIKNRISILLILTMLTLPMIASAANDSFLPSFKDGIMSRVINWGQFALVGTVFLYAIHQDFIRMFRNGFRGLLVPHNGNFNVAS